MHTAEERQPLVAEQETVALSDISNDDVLFFGLLNRFLIENIATHTDAAKTALEENQEIHTFEIPQPRHRTLNFILTHFFGRKSKTWQPIQNTYTNHKFPLPQGILNIFVKKNVTKDTQILYYTTANQIIELQNLGLTSSQALTSKVIETLGHYNLLVAQRRVKSNIVTNKTDLKQYIVSRAQLHARLLQPVERCISTHHDMTAISYAGKITIAVQKYILDLTFAHEKVYNALLAIKTGKASLSPEADLIASLGMSQALLNSFLKYDPNFLVDLENQYEKQIAYATEFLKNSVNEELSASQLSENLQGFLTYQLEETLHYAQAQNDQITANSDDSLFRGKLRDHIIDAQTQINHYVFDQINPITREHQSDFRTQPADDEFGENKVLYQSTVQVGRSKEDQEKVLIGITTLNNTPSLRPPPKVVKSAGWNNYSSQTKGQKLNRFCAWGLTTLCHAPLSLLNIVVTGISGQAPVASWMQRIENYFQKKFKIVNNYDSDFAKFCDKLGGNNLYTSTLIGRLLYKVVNELTSVVVSAPLVIIEKLRQQGNNFVDDFKSGFWKRFIRSTTPAIERELTVFTQTKSNEDIAQLEHWLQTAKKLNHVTDPKFLENNVEYASIKNPLDPYEPHDILSILVHAATGFVEFFKDDIFEKHPVTGFIAALAYVFGGATVLAPGTLKLILGRAGFTQGQIDTIIVVCQNLGRPIAKAGMNQAIASGFTLAKIMGVSMNATSQGFDSALAKVINEVSKDPLLYGAGICVAYGFGNLVTNVFKVPYLTNYLRDEIGTAPAIGRVLIGAKLGMLSLEAALPENEQHPSILAELLGDIATNCMIAARIAVTPLSLSTKPYKDGWNQAKKGFGIIVNGLNKLITTSVQMTFQIPKTLLEVATTLFVNLAKLVDRGAQSLFYRKHNHAVPAAGMVLRIKNGILHIGSQLGFIVRKPSRQADCFCGRLVKEIDHHDHSHAQDYNEILRKLVPVQIVEPPPSLPESVSAAVPPATSAFKNTDSPRARFSLAVVQPPKDCRTGTLKLNDGMSTAVPIMQN